MKKIFLLLIVFTLFSSFISEAYLEGGGLNQIAPNKEELSTSESIFFRAGRENYIRNHAPDSTLNYPTENNPNGVQVVNGNYVEFSWNYYDYEGDTQVNYQLELDDDPRFLSPLTYFGLGETKRRVYILEGNKIYNWRVKGKDDFGWGLFSEPESFYLDSSKKVCEDGTYFGQCSNDFKYCDNGKLINDCSLCGCPLNNECSLSGICLEKTCFDGTRYGSCNDNKKPSFCQNGEIKQVCSLCGCPENMECNADGKCTKLVIFEEKSNPLLIIKEKGFFNKFVNFLKVLF